MTVILEGYTACKSCRGVWQDGKTSFNRQGFCGACVDSVLQDNQVRELQAEIHQLKSAIVELGEEATKPRNAPGWGVK